MGKWQVRCLVEAQAGCGEGPVWDGQTGLLWWVDISGERIHAYDPTTKINRSFEAPYLVSSLVLAPAGLLVATAKGIARFDTKTGALTTLHDPEPDIEGNRLNDMAVAPDGTLWAGTMCEGAAGATGALYRYGPGGVEAKMTGTTISNGLGWSPDGERLYFIDSVPGTLHVREGESWRVVKHFDGRTGKPDGLAVDSKGTLWIAICDRGQIIGMTCDGKIIDSITMPCETVTSCAFGGHDLKTLYVTTGTFSMSEAEKAANPQAGGLFATEMDVPGQASFEARWPH